MFMYDLVEVAGRTEIPEALAATSAWQDLCAASSDITAWCNDLFSLRRETPNSEPTNYVTVLRHALDCTEQTAVAQVRATSPAGSAISTRPSMPCSPPPGTRPAG